MTIDLNFGPWLEPFAASRQVIGVELQGHGHTADTERPMTIEALADDVVALLDHLEITETDLFGFSLGGLVAYAIALGAPTRVGKLIVASADAHRPPGRESAPIDDERMPTTADFQAMHDAYDAVAPEPAHFDEFAAKTSKAVHEFPGWTDELRSMQVPTLLIFGDRDFSPLPDVVEMFELLPNAQLAVLPGTTHMGVWRRPDEVFALIMQVPRGVLRGSHAAAAGLGVCLGIRGDPTCRWRSRATKSSNLIRAFRFGKGGRARDSPPFPDYSREQSRPRMVPTGWAIAGIADAADRDPHRPRGRWVPLLCSCPELPTAASGSPMRPAPNVAHLIDPLDVEETLSASVSAVAPSPIGPYREQHCLIAREDPNAGAPDLAADSMTQDVGACHEPPRP
jgi:pimeloyl-ACP methyl ester carboxylesterase